MHNPKSALENETHKSLWDFDAQTDHLISARRADLIIINKKERTCKIVDFAVPADYRVKLNESEKMDMYLNPPSELEKMWNMKVMAIPIVIGALGTFTKGFIQGHGGLGNKRNSGDCPNYSIVEIGQNTVKCPGDLRRFAVTQSPVKDHS